MPYRQLTDLVFSEVPGFRPLSLDLHLPAVDRPPLVVFLHGGGWRVGSRRTFTPGLTFEETFGRLPDAGWAVASVDYRLSAEAIFPAQLDDVSTALAWLRGHAAEYGYDADRLVLWGESAGAHLACLAGLADPQVRAVVDWYGPADLLTFPQPAGEVTREADLLGGPVADRTELATQASPARQVHAGAPPFLIAHGDADTFVPVQQSIDFADALRTAGVPVDLQLVPGADHMWRGVADPDTVFGPALAFVERVSRR